MGFLDRNNKPKELEGLTDEQIAEKLREGTELKTKLDEANGKVSELSTKFETFSSDFDTKVSSAVESAVGKLAERGKQASSAADKQRETQLTNWLDDPDKALNERLNPLAGVVLQQAAKQGKDTAKAKFQRSQRSNPGKNYDGFFFEKYENEIDELAKTCTVASLAHVETWEHLFYNVKGRHADEIAAQQKEGKFDFDIEGSTTGVRGRNDVDQNSDRLTPIELKVAAKMGRTPEQYLAEKKKLTTSDLGVNI